MLVIVLAAITYQERSIFIFNIFSLFLFTTTLRVCSETFAYVTTIATIT